MKRLAHVVSDDRWPSRRFSRAPARSRQVVVGFGCYVWTVTYTVPEAELEIRATRAGGPGGQHVNKTSTRIEVVWDVAGSPSLPPDLKNRLLARLATRIDTRGRLRVVAAESRSQSRNRDAAVERLRSLVAQALRPRKARKPTKPTAAARERRLEEKRRRGEAKRRRRAPDPE
jgi:ribosome-associated protein